MQIRMIAVLLALCFIALWCHAYDKIDRIRWLRFTSFAKPKRSSIVNNRFFGVRFVFRAIEFEVARICATLNAFLKARVKLSCVSNPAASAMSSSAPVCWPFFPTPIERVFRSSQSSSQAFLDRCIARSSCHRRSTCSIRQYSGHGGRGIRSSRNICPAFVDEMRACRRQARRAR
jgi:hypothetical protein